MLEAVNHGPRFTISLKRSTQNLPLSTKIARPITPSIGGKRTCLFALHMSAYDPKRTSNGATLGFGTFGAPVHDTLEVLSAHAVRSEHARLLNCFSATTPTLFARSADSPLRTLFVSGRRCGRHIRLPCAGPAERASRYSIVLIAIENSPLLNCCASTLLAQQMRPPELRMTSA